MLSLGVGEELLIRFVVVILFLVWVVNDFGCGHTIWGGEFVGIVGLRSVVVIGFSIVGRCSFNRVSKWWCVIASLESRVR